MKCVVGEFALFGQLFDLKASTGTPLVVFVKICFGFKRPNAALTHVLHVMCCFGVKVET